jgi:predicted lipid-binding transport protein (Tim44 family)
MGGLITETLVGLFGLQGLAAAIGFILQTAAVGGVAWLISSYFRNRSAQQVVSGAAELRLAL